jgi:hypothetical protein
LNYEYWKNIENDWTFTCVLFRIKRHLRLVDVTVDLSFNVSIGTCYTHASKLLMGRSLQGWEGGDHIFFNIVIDLAGAARPKEFA